VLNSDLFCKIIHGKLQYYANMSFMLLSLILPFLCRKIQARSKNCQSSQEVSISVYFANSEIFTESYANSVSGARPGANLKNFAISVFVSNSEITPDSYAISEIFGETISRLEQSRY
jgi:hypothetical protein